MLQTVKAEEGELESFYATIQEEIDHTSKQDMIIIGNLNIRVGIKTESNVVGNFAVGVRNKAGDQLMDFCKVNLSITNTCFRQSDDYIHVHTNVEIK